MELDHLGCNSDPKHRLHQRPNVVVSDEAWSQQVPLLLVVDCVAPYLERNTTSVEPFQNIPQCSEGSFRNSWILSIGSIPIAVSSMLIDTHTLSCEGKRGAAWLRILAKPAFCGSSSRSTRSPNSSIYGREKFEMCSSRSPDGKKA
jgi:hypothetical protein